jgi:hypothetical protein
MFRESTGIVINAFMKSSPDIPKMPSGKLRRLLEDFFAEFPNITTDPAWTLESLEEAFVVWLGEEPDTPRSNSPRGMVYDGLERGFRRAPGQPSPKGNRRYVRRKPSPKGNRGHVQPERPFPKGNRGHVRPERPSLKGNLGYVQPEAAEVINSDERLRIEWSTLNDDIRRIYEILGPPPLKMLSGVRDGR